MKRLMVSLLLLVAVVTGANAQDDDRDKLHFGIKAGINIANVYDYAGTDFSPKYRSGFVGGGFVAIPIGTYFGIQPEVLFSQKGTNAQGSINGQPYAFKRTTNSMDVPVFFQVKPIRHLSLVVGPQLSFLLKQRDTFESSDSNVTIEQEFKNQDIRKANIGVVGGVDIDIFKIVVSGRVGADLQKNAKDGEVQTDVPNYKAFWGQITLGLRF